ncbi:hypothetical protein ACFE04_001531 [Oxalis oulophora]
MTKESINSMHVPEDLFAVQAGVEPSVLSSNSSCDASQFEAISCADDYFKFLCKWILEKCSHDLKFDAKRIDKEIINLLETMAIGSCEKTVDDNDLCLDDAIFMELALKNPLIHTLRPHILCGSISNLFGHKSRDDVMKSQFSLVSQLSSGRNYIMCLKVCNVWEGRLPSNPDDVFSVNFLFVDEKGGEIQGSCSPKLSGWFRSTLRIGQIVTISKFSIEANNHVIGVIVGIPFLSGNGSNLRPLPKKILRLKDVGGSEINVVMWSPFDTQIDDSAIIQHADMRRFVVALKGLSFKTFNDELLFSTTSGTMLPINDVISVYHDYDDIFKPSAIVVNDLRGAVDVPLQVVDQSIAQLLTTNADWHVDQVFSCKAKIIGINNENGWWYKG